MFRNSLNPHKISQDFGDAKVTQFRNITRWMNKTVDGSTPGYEKFTYCFIAFNIFYNLKYDHDFPDESIWESNEFQRICHVIPNDSDTHLEKIYRQSISATPDFLELLEKYQLKHRLRNGNYEDLVHSLKLNVKREDYSKALEKLLACMYAIRCNLFHGEKEPDDFRQNKLLQESEKVLRKILSILLEPYFLDK